jgi:glycosyltransferase involved in cell wall biosynthesis
MRDGQKILFVSEKFPWPVDDGGQIRTYNVLATLAREFRVALVALEPPSPADEQPIRDLGVDVKTFRRVRPRWAMPWYVAQSLVTRAPYPLHKNFSRAMLSAIRRELASGEVGALHMNQIDAVQYVEHLGLSRPGAPTARRFETVAPAAGRSETVAPTARRSDATSPESRRSGTEAGVRTVFDTLNVLTTMYERFADAARDPLRKAYCTLQWRKMSRYERAIMRAVDRVLVCSEIEKDLLRVWGVELAMLVPNGVDTERYAFEERPAKAASTAPAVVFSGGMDYLPNQDGVRWFIEAVLPQVRKLVPNLKLTVVGKNPPPSLLALAKPDEIEITGRVDDVRPYVRRSDALVVPLRIGGGTRLKILEALAMGVPVISTSVGAEGIAVTNERDIVIADEPTAIASAIASVCASRERAALLARRGRELVESRYDWPSVTRELVEYYRAI